MTESAENKNLPIGGGLWSTVLYHPRGCSSISIHANGLSTIRSTNMPESTAPKLGKVSNVVVTMDVDVPIEANGVLYALAGFSGGLACYVRDNQLHYEFNLFTVRRTKIKRGSRRLKTRHSTKSRLNRSWSTRSVDAIDVTLRVDGSGRSDRAAFQTECHCTSPAMRHLTLGPIAIRRFRLDYYDEAPFSFNGNDRSHTNSVHRQQVGT